MPACSLPIDDAEATNQQQDIATQNAYCPSSCPYAREWWQNVGVSYECERDWWCTFLDLTQPFKRKTYDVWELYYQCVDGDGNACNEEQSLRVVQQCFRSEGNVCLDFKQCRDEHPRHGALAGAEKRSCGDDRCVICMPPPTWTSSTNDHDSGGADSAPAADGGGGNDVATSAASGAGGSGAATSSVGPGGSPTVTSSVGVGAGGPTACTADAASKSCAELAAECYWSGYICDKGTGDCAGSGTPTLDCPQCCAQQ
jgi:hypothetical protein